MKLSAPTGLEVKASCVVTDTTVGLHAAIPTHFKFTGETARLIGRSEQTERTLWWLMCSRQSKACDGVQLDLAGVDKGAPLAFMDVTSLQGARLVSETGGVYVVQFGPWRTLSIDPSAQRVSYAEKGPTTVGRGEARCSTGVDALR